MQKLFVDVRFQKLIITTKNIQNFTQNQTHLKRDSPFWRYFWQLRQQNFFPELSRRQMNSFLIAAHWRSLPRVYEHSTLRAWITQFPPHTGRRIGQITLRTRYNPLADVKEVVFCYICVKNCRTEKPQRTDTTPRPFPVSVCLPCKLVTAPADRKEGGTNRLHQ